jgi:cyclopropane-fatty-acyl-phospholipid synthase
MSVETQPMLPNNLLPGSCSQPEPQAPVSSMPWPWLDRACFSAFDACASSAIRYGVLRLVLPDGSERVYGSAETAHSAVPGAPLWRALPPRRCTATVKRTDMFFKVITRHDSGLGEAFTAGDYEVDDLGAFLAVLTANARQIEASRGLLGALNTFGSLALYVAHLGRSNTVSGSKKNIKEHYDAGNDMYKLFLDETLTYSAGIHHQGDSLKQSQLNKLDALVHGAVVSESSHVLEVGCGWGSCAIRAVQLTGCRWTGTRTLTVTRDASPAASQTDGGLTFETPAAPFIFH